MQKRKQIYKLWVFLLAMCFAPFVMAQSPKESNTIRHGFKVTGKSQLEVSNKYGEIVIRNHDKDSVLIEIEIIAYGKDYSAARKSLKRIDFDIRQSGQFITVETIFDRKTGIIKDVFNSIGDYSKSLLSKNKIEVNYQITMPASMRLIVENKFGDVFLEDRNANTDISISHGNFRANKLFSRSDLSISYGDVNVKYVEDGDFTLKAVSRGEFKSIDNAKIKSASSDITIEKAKRLKLESKGDKNYFLEELDHLDATISFTPVEIGICNKSLELKSSYGGLTVAYMPNNFSFVQINGKATDIDIAFDNQSWIETNIEAKEDDLTITGNKTTLKKAYVEDKKGVVRITGFIGRKNVYSAQLGVKAYSGNIKLSLNGDRNTARK